MAIAKAYWGMRTLAKAGVASRPLFNFPCGLVWLSGVLYVADNGNACIRSVTKSGSVVTVATYAGVGGSQGLQNGTIPPASNVLFNTPYSLSVDGSGNLYIYDNASANLDVREITPAGVVSTTFPISGATARSRPAFDSGGNHYVAGNNGYYNAIYKNGVAFAVVSPNDIVVAGNFIYAWDQTGGWLTSWNLTTVAKTQLYQISDTLSLMCYDGGDIIYISDDVTCQILAYSISGNSVSVFASGFNYPYGIALDGAGNMYVADNQAIYIVPLATGVKALYAGQVGVGGYQDGNQP
jgi:hypothetical protein